jgi:hypothetical protein
VPRRHLQSRRSSKSSKSDAATANIPSGINVSKEDISQNPESFAISQLYHKEKGRNDSPPVKLGFAAAPARQVLEPWETGPRLNEAGVMLTVFPPTSIEMGMSNVQGTRVLKISKCRVISGTGEHTSVDALSNLGRRLGTTDLFEKVRNASWIAKNLGCSSVEDCCCAPYCRLSVHRNAIERRLPVALLTKSVSALATINAFELPQTSTVKGTQVKSPV